MIKSCVKCLSASNIDNSRAEMTCNTQRSLGEIFPFITSCEALR